MAASMDFSPLFVILEGGQNNKDNVSTVEAQTSENNLKQITNWKPPQHLSVTCHSMSSKRLLATAELVS